MSKATKPVAKPKLSPVIDPDANFTGHFRIYDLPQELCNLIFAEVCRTLPRLLHVTRIGDLTITVHLLPKATDQRVCRATTLHLSTWLRKHKRFIQDLYHFGGWTAAVPGVSPTTSFNLSTEVFMDTSLCKASNELRQSQARQGRHKSERMITDADNAFIDTNLQQSLTPGAALLRRLVRSMADCMGEKVLYLSFGLDTSLFQRITGQIKIDLSGLETLGLELDRLVVQVPMWDVPGRTSKEMEHMVCVGLEREIDRLGRALIGGMLKMNCVLVSGHAWIAVVRRANLA
ncbi:hypothetical protein SLS59_007039 [Nothophoma quercina]|uniref:Uncharacterized protein n=1 Tax=Nothophoma quercina TaxID=749835 RepID=A0ABR3R1Q3_9PLEO